MTMPESTEQDAAPPDEVGVPDILTRLDLLTRTVEEVRKLRIRDRDLIDQLHRDNDELRKDQLTSAMMPLFRSLFTLYDLMTAAPAGDGTIPVLLSQLVQTLEINGVTVDTPQPGEPFDSSRQDGMPTPTDEPAEDNTVAALVKAGFLRSGRVLRAAQVQVYRLRQPAESTSRGPA